MFRDPLVELHEGADPRQQQWHAPGVQAVQQEAPLLRYAAPLAGSAEPAGK